jgi:hypothetical protein
MSVEDRKKLLIKLKNFSRLESQGEGSGSVP